MAFEQFKTQVLLLHSEQRTLDVLSAGFNDRYELHCATSGTEALTTLGETPVDIIVSAQKLPGMSGVDALREAKRRSPGTIAILLAGADADDGLEALVGDKEVFQVVRGELTPEKLLSIVENATRTARLMTLSESANDTSAAVDEPQPDDEETGEHVVMETGENGSFIISDGTGRMPALKPEQVSATPTAGGRQVDLLVLTQDDEFLETIRQSTSGIHKVHHAVRPDQAENFVRNFPVGLIVTDAGLAGSTVEALTQRMRIHQKRLVAIVAGRRDDGEMLMDLINRGQVYRFLLKPVSPGRARLAIEASVKHHLEAPEHAFQGRPAAKKPAMPPAPPPRPPVGKAAKPVLKPVPDTAPATPAGNKPAPPSVKRPAASTSQAKDGLGGALETVSSFTETIAGFGSTLGNSLSKAASRHKGSHAATDKDVRAATATAPETAGGAPLMNPKTIGVAAVILVIAGAGLMMLGGDEDPMPPAGPATETAVATESPAQTEAAGADARLAAASRSPAGPVAGTAPRARTGNETQSLMEEARAALAAGDLYSPAGRNAVEFLVAARDAAPGDAAIAAELDSVVDDVFGRAEAALLDNRTTEASRALRVIGIADPDNPRLKFLNAQFDRQQMATTLDKARLAIRESRFEDAGRLLAQTETFAGADTTELDALSNELARARNAQQLDEVLALASERLDDNRLVSPSNDNARYFFELARTIDPDSSAARQGLVAVAGKLVLRARTAIDGGDLDAADALLTDARALDADSQELAAADAALVAARSPDTAVPNVRPVATAETPASDTSTRSTTTETPSEQNTASPPSTASQAAAEAQAEPRAGASTPQEITSIASVKRTKYVAPNYPRSAQRRDITGYVDVAFTVTETGSVADVEVREADPADVFEDAAIKAVEQWKFEPPVDDGIAVSKRVAVRMSFNLQ